MSSNVPKIVTTDELNSLSEELNLGNKGQTNNHKLLYGLNLDKGDQINILKAQMHGGVKEAKEMIEFILKQKAIEAKIDLKIRKENAKLEIEIKEADFKIEKEREKLKNEKNQAVRDSLLQQEKEKNRLTVKLADNQRKIAANEAENKRLTVTDPIKQREKTNRTQARAENADKIGAGIGNAVAGIGKGAGAVVKGAITGVGAGAGAAAGNPMALISPAIAAAKELGVLMKRNSQLKESRQYQEGINNDLVKKTRSI